jgi:hypothetical protein
MSRLTATTSTGLLEERGGVEGQENEAENAEDVRHDGVDVFLVVAPPVVVAQALRFDDDADDEREEETRLRQDERAAGCDTATPIVTSEDRLTRQGTGSGTRASVPRS